MPTLIGSLQTINQLLTAGIAITAFSLLLYVLSFNLRDWVARSVAAIFLCVVIIFVGDAIASVTTSPAWIAILVKLQWIGIMLLPPTYLTFSDALLATTGRPSRGRRSRLIRLTYLIAVAFVIALPFPALVGSVQTDFIAPHLNAPPLIWLFAAFYLGSMIWAWVNFWRAYKRSVTSTSRRRMRYLIAGAFAPAFGTFPYMTFGAGFVAGHSLIFWVSAIILNLLTAFLIVLMAYGAAFFGVSWPDRVVKRRLFKWLMRGPVTASSVLAMTTLVRRAGESLGVVYSAAVPFVMVATLLLMQYAITLLAPIWERWLFYGGDRDTLQLVQTLEERILTTGDLRQFLEAILTAVCDRLQIDIAFAVTLAPPGQEMFVAVGDMEQLDSDELSEDMLTVVARNGGDNSLSASSLHLFAWGQYWLAPFFAEHHEDENGEPVLLGLLGFERLNDSFPEEEQREALETLVHRAALAIDDRLRQQHVFNSLEMLTPQVDWIQRLRAASRYDGTSVLSTPQDQLERENFSKWVKDALRHYWGGPKLTKSPLLQLEIVQRAMDEHDGISVNALRSVLREGIERIRPEGKRRFTTEWILFNILEMKFMEGRTVRDVASRLAMSEADLYRKQRAAIDVVADAIIKMEREARLEKLEEN